MELAILAALAAVAWFWHDSLGAREAAVAAARHACKAEGVMLLDDTVAVEAVRLRRNGEGHIAILRVYGFEFSDTGNNRLDGSITVLGRDVQTFYLAPHLGSGALPVS